MSGVTWALGYMTLTAPVRHRALIPSRVLEGASLSWILDDLSIVAMYFPVVILSGLLSASFGEPKVDDNRI